MNDVGLSFDDEMDNQSQVCHAMYNTQITEDSCVYTTRMIVKGTELICTYVQEQMIPKQEQENFVEMCAWCVQTRYGETRAKKFIALSETYSQEGDGDRKCRVKKKECKLKGNWSQVLLCRNCLGKNANQTEHHLESMVKRNHQDCWR